MPTIYNNVCSLGCHASCRFKTYVEKGKILNITGDPDDPYTCGSLCARGYAFLERLYSPERIIYPMKQVNKGTDSWQRISWEQALREIAEIIIEIKRKEGNLWPVCFDQYLGTVGVLSRSIEGFFNSIGFITKMIGSPCESTGSDALLLSYGSCKKPIPEDMLNSRLIIIWGGNPAWTVPHQMRYVFEAKEKGAKIVVIDPLFSATAARSDLYIQVNPGTDGDLALGMAKILRDEDLIDRPFLEKYTKGWPEFINALENLNLEDVASSTGIPQSGIKELARLYGRIKPAAIWLGLGAQRTPAGGQSYLAINALAALTGNIGQTGGNVHYFTYDMWDFSGEFANLKPPEGSSSNLHERLLQHRAVPTGRFSSFMKLNPAVQFLWVAGRNPVSQDPDTSLVKQALSGIPTVVAADLYMTQTARYANYFLPVTTPFEAEDIVISFWHYGAAFNEKAIEPVGECKSDFQIMRELAATLNTISPGFSSFPIDREATEWLDLEMQKLYPLIGIRHYRELAGGHHRVNLPPVAWENKRFQTSSGKYELTHAYCKSQVTSSTLDFSKESLSSAAYPFHLLSPKSVVSLNSQFGNSKLLQSMEKTSIVLINPEVGRHRNIVTGDTVKVYNQLGEINLEAYLTPSVPMDSVVVYMDAGGVELNTLISLVETDLGDAIMGVNGLSFHHSYVNLYKVE
jgi:Anaerobic dehydrogenases, typically selenocysteine-containing